MQRHRPHAAPSAPRRSGVGRALRCSTSTDPTRRARTFMMAFMTVRVDRWGEHGPRPEPNHALDPLFAAMTVAVEQVVGCSAADAWALVCAVERIGEFSLECVQAWWVPGY